MSWKLVGGPPPGESLCESGNRYPNDRCWRWPLHRTSLQCNGHAPDQQYCGKRKAACYLHVLNLTKFLPTRGPALILFMPYLLALFIGLSLYSCTPRIASVAFTEDHSFTEGIEGPTTDEAGNVYAVNFARQGTVGRVTPEGTASVFLTLPEGSIGNGIRFGSAGNMYIADYTGHNILEVDTNSLRVRVLAHEPTANQPNDLAIAPDGTLYASDPNWADSTGNLWKISKEDGFELLEANMGTTNGIEVSPDGKRLYVNESIQRNIWVYDRQPDGSLTSKRLLYSFADYGLDGMRCDASGNLFVARYGKGTVAVLSPRGRLIREISLGGKKPTNVTFNPDFSRCYITLADRGRIEVIYSLASR